MHRVSLKITIFAVALTLSTFAYASDKRCLGTLRFSRTSNCDADKDGLTNKRETKLRTNLRKADTDNDGLSDGAEVKIFHTSPRDSDSDDNCIFDGNDDANANARSDEDEDDPHGQGNMREDRDDDLRVPNCTGSGDNGNGQNCRVESPIDSNGNTSAFGIPTGYVGNVSLGLAQFEITCSECHGSNQGKNLSFSSLKSTVEGFPMNIRSLSLQQLADLTAFVNRTNTGGGNVVCD